MSKKYLKHLISKSKKKSGRNNTGKITVRRRGGGHKRLYRKIDFNFSSSKYFILKREYDPNRNIPINLVKCLNIGNFFYILGQENLKEGSFLDLKKQIINGGRYYLKDLPSNYIVSNVELNPRKGGQLSRSSGSFCKILQKDLKKRLIKIKLPSLEERYVPMDCKGSVGPITNTFQHIKKLKKAGIVVDCGLLEDQARQLNKGFFKRHERGIPWILVKMASSIDGRTAMASGQSQWVTTPAWWQTTVRNESDDSTPA